MEMLKQQGNQRDERGEIGQHMGSDRCEKITRGVEGERNGDENKAGQTAERIISLKLRVKEEQDYMDRHEAERKFRWK
jgi:hypothetical protein